MNRRSFLRIGLAGALGGPSLSRVRLRAKANRVLVVFEQGGMSHVDTFDPKPDAPVEHRSPFKPVRTSVTGVHFTGLFRRTAKQMDKLSVVRCMHQPTPGIGDSHPRAGQYVFSGQPPGGPVERPDIGSIVAYRLGSAHTSLPPYIMVPGNGEVSDRTRLGFLPPRARVFKTGGEDLSDPHWRLRGLDLLAGVDARRFKERIDLLNSLDVGLDGAAGSDVGTMQSVYARAKGMLLDPNVRKLFDLASVDERTRDLYGRGHRGRCYLLARRLIEAGVRYVMLDVHEPVTKRTPGAVFLDWDHHDLIYSKGATNLPGGAGPGRYGIGTWPMAGSTDRAFSGLIEDMHRRGLLADTLVCFVTEFGRTPRINARQGRDHWTNAFTCLFAGAGVPGGQVVGSTDRDGGYITSGSGYTFEDLAATIYTKLGMNLRRPMHMPNGRPVALVANGSPIPELF